MKVSVLDVGYEEQSSIELSDSVFGVVPRGDILSRVVRWQLAKRRAGTHSVKTISEVSGSGKKIVKQKGSGGARHGSKRGTQFRGGGIVFGPTPRSYEFSLQKKVRKLGLRMAIADKIQSNELVVLQNFDFEFSKTNDFVKLCEAKDITSALFVDGSVNDNVARMVSNSQHYDVIPQIGLNVYDILRKDFLVVTVSAIELLEARLG
ncbi:MAG: 50S ribosomal protein L4 [Holosporales bacterium]|jgi:large subunit ribosomal protein L4|nr:50S ribosomal protein L4 [Holosporales bacterium]